MLVIVWETMYAAIPRLQAQEWLDAYNVAVLAQPIADRNAHFARQRVLDAWVRLASPVRRAVETTIGRLREMLVDAFEEQIRE